MMDYLYKIRFLSKPLSGRELYLREGSFSLGPEDCDVWVTLEGYPEKNIILEIKSEGIAVQKNTTLWIDGILHEVESGGLLPLNSALDIAGVHFVLGNADNELSHILAEKRKQSEISPEKSNVRGIFIAVMLLLSIVLLGTVGYTVTDAKAEYAAPLHLGDVKKRVLELERQRVLPGINFNWQPDDTVDIQGQCKNEELLQPVLEFLKQNAVHYSLNVVCDDRLVKNVLDVLQLNGFDRVVAYMDKDPGKVVISGQIDEDIRWQHVVNLLNDMHGLRSWVVKSVNDKELDALIAGLRKTKLLPMLSVQRIDERVVVSGKLNAQERDSLYALIRRHMVAFPGTQEVIYQNINTSSSALGVLPSPVSSIGGNNDYPYLLLEDGSRLQKGAVLPGGYQIQNIDSVNGIELIRHGELLHLPLGF